LGHGVVAEPHAPDDTALQVVDVALVVGLDVHVEADGIRAHGLHGVDVGRAIDVPLSTQDGIAHGSEAERTPRQLPVAPRSASPSPSARALRSEASPAAWPPLSAPMIARYGTGGARGASARGASRVTRARTWTEKRA